MKIRLLVVLLTACVSLLLGCSRDPAPTTKTVEVSLDDVQSQKAITKDVTLRVGDTLKLSLGANHTTPFRWAPDPKLSDAAVLTQATHEYQRGNTDRMGAPGTEVWTFTAAKAGKTTIVTSYGSVVGDATPTCTFTANVTVQ